MNDPRVLTLDSIAPFADPPDSREMPSNRLRLPLKGYSIGRRGFLRTVLGAGTVAGFATLGIFPNAKQASAACISALENFISGPCPQDVGNCSPACGPSLVLAAACGSNQFHRYTGSYRNRPDSCNGVAEADGWMWYGPAGGCSCPPGGIRGYRCHDGCTNMSGTWTNTICRQTASGCII
jgi:hypothetical protein